jgi:hypothetical protein
MNLVQSPAIAPRSRRHETRHAFVIGPLCDSDLTSRKARLYYCRLCEWRFLVCGDKVAVLDARGEPLTGPESASRFSTFEEGPCPVLETFASAAFAEAPNSAPSLRRKYDEFVNLASSYFRAGPSRARPLLRVLGNLGRH